MAWLRTGGYLLLALVLAWAVVATRNHLVGVGEKRVQASWDAQVKEDRRAAAENALELERLARASEARRQAQAEESAREQASIAASLRTAAARAEQRNRSLRDTIDRLNRRDAELSRAAANAGAGPGPDGAATVARDVFGECSTRRRELAAEAGSLAGQVIGLQRYAAICQGTP